MPNAILESVKDFNTITIFRHVLPTWMRLDLNLD